MDEKQQQGVMVLHEEAAAPPPSLFIVFSQKPSGPDAEATPPEIPSKPPEISSKPHEISSKPHEISSKPPEISSKPHEISSKPHEISSKPPEISSKPHEISSNPHEISSNTAQMPNLPADVRVKGVTVTLDNNNMWNEFYRCDCEMILTRLGRRMFPNCRFRLSGLEPFQSYSLAMDVVPVDQRRYRWNQSAWEASGKCEPHVPRLFLHPDSPALGLHWMQSPVSFFRLKVSTNASEKPEHIVLHSMHRYLPRLHLIPGEQGIRNFSVDQPDVVSVSFPQTQFFAVTAYQNTRITQLKIDYNPFAKRFREHSVTAAATNGTSEVKEKEPSKEATTINNLKSLFLKRNSKLKACEDQNGSKNEDRTVENREASAAKNSSKTQSDQDRPSPSELSIIMKAPRVKVRRLSLDKIIKNGVFVDKSSAKSAVNVSEIIKVNVEQPRVNTDQPQRNDSASTIQKFNSNEEKTDAKSRSPDSHGTLLLDGLVKAGVKKTLPHKRPRPVPLPLFAQFIKQRKSRAVIAEDSGSSAITSSCDAAPPVSQTISDPSPDALGVTNTTTSSPDSGVENTSDPEPCLENTLPNQPVLDGSSAPSLSLNTDGGLDDVTVPSGSANQVLSNQNLSPSLQLESESIPGGLLDSSQTPCPELFSADVLSNSTSCEEAPSLPLDEPLSPSFSIPSPTPSSPDPFPPNLFTERPPPPRKVLDSFPDRLLDCSGTSISDHFQLGLYERPVVPRPSYKCDAPIDLLFPNNNNNNNDSLSPSHLESSEQVTEAKDSDPPVPSSECEKPVSDPPVIQPAKPSSNSRFVKTAMTTQTHGKLKITEDLEMFRGAVPEPMQPSLEDVEGQLFVSFVSKDALKFHIGEDASTPNAPENIGCRDERMEKIEALEKILIQDLSFMKHRQVIHPVLQEVGLKLSLLDVTLEIDLQYLGVQLPIPPPVQSSASPQGQFVSRTGKTTDFTKIKGWREKFVGSGSQSDGVFSTDADLSAFCSDMLDEYLASEGKLIDERVANLAPNVETPVAYQLPTKSTSYVRTLDSVLKKHPGPESEATDVQPASKRKRASRANKRKATGSEDQTDSVRPQRRKRLKSMEAEISARPAAEKANALKVVDANRRSAGLTQTLVKLMDVEDGAVWEGKHRTCITEERAAIALSRLVMPDGTLSPEATRIIRRRAPPCLNVFCRLGCVCASLSHSRRHHHCGKPQCMLGCSCLRRKVVALKTPKVEEELTEEPPPQDAIENDKARWKKKNKARKAYVLTDADRAPEAAERVKTLWDQTRGEEEELLFTPPPPAPLLLSQELQRDLEDFLSPAKHTPEDTDQSLTEKDVAFTPACARVLPFYWNPEDRKRKIEQQDLEIEEGELVPFNTSSPSKRLEIISECSWADTDTRNDVMRTVCERMAQDQLYSPFWIQNYYIQPISKVLQQRENGPVYTYQVKISSRAVNAEETVPPQQAEPETPRVNGLPFLSSCRPAGLLTAQKKAPDAPGLITVNGKSYPKAKLELGMMGALHPANRLAGYITGRLRPGGQGVSRATETASTPPATAAGAAPAVVKSSQGKTFTQLVGQTGAPLSKIIIPMNRLVTLPTAPAVKPALASDTNSPSAPQASTPGQAQAAASTTSPGSPAVKRKHFVTVLACKPGASAAGLPLLTDSQTPQSPSRKIMLQMVKTADGKVLFRNPSGQLLQMIPLSQFKSMNSNLQPKTQYLLAKSNLAQLTNLQSVSGTVATSSSAPSTAPPTQLATSQPSPAFKIIPKVLGRSAPCTVQFLPSSVTVKDTGTSSSGVRQESARPPGSTTSSLQSSKGALTPSQASKDQPDPTVAEVDVEIGDAEVEIALDNKRATDESDVSSDAEEEDVSSSSSSSSRSSDNDENPGDQTEEDMVDIETVDGRDEKFTISKLKAAALRSNSQQKSNKELILRDQRMKQERLRRHNLKGNYIKLAKLLKLSISSPCIRILHTAQVNIKSLVEEQSALMVQKKQLIFQKKRYLRTLSRLSDKSTHSICQKLDEIIQKQKALENQTNAKPRLSQATPTMKSKARASHTPSPSKPVDLRVPQRRSLKKAVPEDTPPAQKRPEKPVTPNTPYPAVVRERTRPNILSRSSATPPAPPPPPPPQLLSNVCIPHVFPVVNTMIPCGQFIALNGQLQPISITSAGPSTGVAAVSITLPAVSQQPLLQLGTSISSSSSVPLLENIIPPNTTAINLTQRAEDLSKPAEDLTKSPDLTKPPEDLSGPAKDLTQHAEDLTKSPDLTKPPEDLTQHAEDLTKPSEDLTQHAEDLTKSPDLTKPPEDLSQHAEDLTKPPEDLTKPPENHTNHADLTKPPEDLTKPPEDLISHADLTKPPEDLTKPPEDLTNHPEHLTNHPKDLIKPPEDLTKPPKHFTRRPEDLSKPAGPDETHASEDRECDEHQVKKPSRSHKAPPSDSSDTEDENLMSLLDELVLLSQQMDTDTSEPTNDEPAVEEQDEERSLTPLSLTLSEDLSPEASSDNSQAPPPVDELVKAIFGSDSPLHHHEEPEPNPPPPLVHMKSSSRGEGGAWRPMPKLVPLGLKAQDGPRTPPTCE